MTSPSFGAEILADLLYTFSAVEDAEARMSARSFAEQHIESLLTSKTHGDEGEASDHPLVRLLMECIVSNMPDVRRIGMSMYEAQKRSEIL